MHDIWAWIKGHPLATAGIVFVVGLLVIWWWFSGSSSNGAVQVQGSAPDNSTALADIAAQAQGHAIDTQASIAEMQTAAALEMSRNDLTAQLAGIQAGAGVLNQQSSLAANVASQTVAAQRDVTLAGLAAQVVDVNRIAGAEEYVNYVTALAASGGNPAESGYPASQFQGYVTAGGGTAPPVFSYNAPAAGGAPSAVTPSSAPYSITQPAGASYSSPNLTAADVAWWQAAGATVTPIAAASGTNQITQSKGPTYYTSNASGADLDWWRSQGATVH